LLANILPLRRRQRIFDDILPTCGFNTDLIFGSSCSNKTSVQKRPRSLRLWPGKILRVEPS
jgi:hypothetical protein